MCTSFRRNESGVCKREEIFGYFAQLSDSPKDKTYFALLKAHVSLFLKVPVYRSYLQISRRCLFMAVIFKFHEGAGLSQLSSTFVKVPVYRSHLQIS